MLTRARLAEHRNYLYLIVAAIVIFLLLPQIIGFNRALHLLASASPAFLSLALIAESLRYLLSALTTWLLCRLFRHKVPYEPLVEAFFAGAAANRTFSTGGAPGMLIRLLFLRSQGILTGSVAVIFLIEDLAGLVVGTIIFVIGVIALLNAHPSNAFILNSALVIALGTSGLGLALLYLYRHRTWIEKAAHAAARAASAVTVWLLGRPIYKPQVVDHAVGEFYAGMAVARRSPGLVAAAFVLNLARYLAGAAALYFAFLSLGWNIPIGILILMYTSASVLSTVSAVPGELALMGGSWAVLTLSFGLPRDLAMVALIVSRTMAFWLPIPIGLAALWHLRRQHYL